MAPIILHHFFFSLVMVPWVEPGLFWIIAIITDYHHHGKHWKTHRPIAQIPGSLRRTKRALNKGFPEQNGHLVRKGSKT